jgi:glycosyltransferase involved in cell wall biosynthesis/2-polyprenyl-3-methyl-5-hydroxy-6-metoxy-1,4-benzoquinol methylase
LILRIAFAVDSVPFTKAVRDGETSLGGSESACLGLARALARRGHQVHVFATKLSEDAEGPDAAGVQWHPLHTFADLSAVFHWDLFVALRMPSIFNGPIRARYRMLWNQDLMTTESFKNSIMAIAWNVDEQVYVSDFHRKQWEEYIPEIAGTGYVTRNGYDPRFVPTDAVKNPNRIIHISRPERGLAPLLMMWPAFKQAHPSATLDLCRYSSMYDASGWGEVCKLFDSDVEKLNAEVGGIRFLGELSKPELYRAIAESAVMWYPGVPTFAETSCIAAIEAQACGTPFVGSFKGALPETVPWGALIRGDAFEDSYQADSMDAVGSLLYGCRNQTKRYRSEQERGREHVKGYTYDAIAAEWEAHILSAFQQRYESNKIGVLRALMHEDDMIAAQQVTRDIADQGVEQISLDHMLEVNASSALIDRIIKGEDHTSDDYSERSMDPIVEMQLGSRVSVVAEQFEGCTSILDVASGNGAFALAIALKYPAAHITAVDFSPGNIVKAEAAAKELGLSDRVTFVCAPVWDFASQQPSTWLRQQIASADETGPHYDGLFVGEFIEHIADCSGFVDAIEQVVKPGAQIVYTCPSGPIGVEYASRHEPSRRSHVHHFTHDELMSVWGHKQEIVFQYMRGKRTDVGSLAGGWMITYRASDAKAGQRNYQERIVKTRPRLTLTVGILAHNAECDIARCLSSVYAVADEILIADTGSLDNTRVIAEHFGAKVRVIPSPHVNEQPEGFAGARNAVLAEAKGDWFLWIDTDEILTGAQCLRAYMETGGPFLGFALKQNHFQLDAPFHFDTPVRIFRTTKPIKFYGCVHEQPQLNDCNGDIHPALQLDEAQIAHFGYLVAGVRKQKAYGRNRPLLLRDRQVFPDRRLGKVIWLRQLQQDGDELAQAVGYQDSRVRNLFGQAVTLFQTEFSDPKDKYHSLGRMFYENALKALDLGTEIEFAMAGKRGGLQANRAKPSRIWVHDAAELKAILDHETSKVLDQMTQKAVRVDPYVQKEESVHA